MRLTAEQELDLAYRIRAAEDGAFGAARKALGTLPRAGSGPNARVERLEACIEQLRARLDRDPGVRQALDQVRKGWFEAERLRWELAMSGIRIAKGEARKLGGRLLSVEDLEQEGIIGLLRAARRFDPDRELRFSTYARWWVRAQMTRAMETTGRTVRLPGGAVEQLRNLRQLAELYEQEGVEVDLDTLAGEVGIEAQRARMLLGLGGTVSLDHEDADGNRAGDLLADDTADAPDLWTSTRESISRVRDALHVALDDRERIIVIQRYGLDGEPPRTMADIGRELGLSRERVRQLEKAAIERLRGSLAA